MPLFFAKRPILLRTTIGWLAFGPLALVVTRMPAQGLAVGSLTMTIVDDRGAPVREATVTVERAGVALRSFTAGLNGSLIVPVLRPGRYAVLAEQFGYQPVRMRDIEIVGGGMTRISIRLARRPPPITAVEEQASNATTTGPATALAAEGRDITDLALRHDIAGVAGAFSQADVPRDGRSGFVASGNGLPPVYSSLFVDGVHETLLRHPGLPGEPASTPLFARDGVDRVTFAGFGMDGSVPTMGALLGAETTSGGQRFSFRPWGTFSSAKLGGRSADNPGDSSATSIQAGFAMGGPIQHDTASWFLRADYQRLQQPSADPFDATRVTTDSGTNLLAGVRSTAQALGHPGVGSWLAPVVRGWQGGSISGRLDWRFGPTTLLAVRAGGAFATEDNPEAGTDLVNGASTRLKSRDISVAAGLTTGGDAWTSDTRFGVRNAKRDWTGAALPYT
ncbi:MAG: carboxypeptidase-like regulatory domain-containing protein, partial [Gemmatimonadales bacterium]